MRFFLLALAALGFLSLQGAGYPPRDEKVILIRVDEIGTITDGMDTITTDELSEYISKRLFKSYIGTGKMYESIRIEKIHDGPMLEVMDIILKEIHLGQKKALTDLSLHLYKQGFDSLKENQQEKIRKKFPVLFQAVI
jgi:hypothetical protein